ncbi:Unknown protein [Striga hermonthica]|uniref:Uncharacterized protein n=1 Tax=Striga hermonthica TaxID=68872 RepID=A0A9N7R2G0_STRHE|nr:Unknown protein [Striga hermonthica]
MLTILQLTWPLFKVKFFCTSFYFVCLEDLDLARLSLHLNHILELCISITNHNFVGFRYTSNTALRCKGGSVGEVPISCSYDTRNASWRPPAGIAT